MRVVLLSILLFSAYSFACGDAPGSVEPGTGSWMGGAPAHNKGRDFTGARNPDEVLRTEAHRMDAPRSSPPPEIPIGMMVMTVLDESEEEDCPVVSGDETANGGAGQGQERVASFLGADEVDESSHQERVASWLASQGPSDDAILTADELFSRLNRNIRRERRESIERGEPGCPLFGQLDSHFDVLAKDPDGSDGSDDGSAAEEK